MVPSRRGLIAVSMKASELDILKEENAALREELLSASMSTRRRLALPVLGLAGVDARARPGGDEGLAPVDRPTHPRRSAAAGWLRDRLRQQHRFQVRDCPGGRAHGANI